MKVVILALFVVLAGLAWALDDTPIHPPTQTPTDSCVWWIEGRYQEVKCPN